MSFFFLCYNFFLFGEAFMKFIKLLCLRNIQNKVLKVLSITSGVYYRTLKDPLPDYLSSIAGW